MKYTMREGCWETNSSSMHSMVIMKNTGQYTLEEMINDIYITPKGVWRIHEDDLNFGRWPFAILSTFAEKVRYAIASFAGSYRSYNEGCEFIDNTLYPILKKYIPGFEEIRFPSYWKPVYRDQDGNDLEPDDVYYHVFEDGEYSYGYERDGNWYHAVESNDDWELSYFGEVDHQSCTLLQSFLEREKISLEDFLINRQYIVIIDGDEYCAWDKFLKSGIIDRSKIDHEYPNVKMPMDEYIYMEEHANEENN